MFIRPLSEIQRDLGNQSESFWAQRGEKMALDLFHRMAREVPAYTDFLGAHNVEAEKIKNIENFKKEVPIMDKKNYIEAYSLEDRSWPESKEGGAVVYASSGTTGKPTFWKRYSRHDQESALFHKVILERNFHISSRKTLFIDCFMMGIHVAGYVTAVAINNLLKEYPHIALITPGTKRDDIIEVLFSVAHHYDQVVLIGYPPFIKDLIVEATEKGFDWSTIRPGFIFSAQGFSEAWREHVRALVQGGAEMPVMSIYGSADGGPFGFETPQTIALRKRLEAGEIITDFTLAHVEHAAPHLFQYFPDMRYFESLNEEIIVTADNGVPLVRYNMHDQGGVATPRSEDSWQLPYVYLFGRSNYTVVFYGANVYPEHIQHILETTTLRSFCTGRFFMHNQEDDHFNQTLSIHLQVRGAPAVPNLAEEVYTILIEGLIRINKEFANSFHETRKPDAVRIFVHDVQDDIFLNKKLKEYIV